MTPPDEQQRAAVQIETSASIEAESGATAIDCLVMIAGTFGMSLTTEQVVRDNLLPGADATSSHVIRCAQGLGLKATAVQLAWADLAGLKARVPAILRLKNGACVVLTGVADEHAVMRVTLKDPRNPRHDIVVDEARLADAWTGETIILKKNHDIRDEDQPFSLRFIAGVLFRERRIVRDVAIAAVMLGVLALVPIMFWRLMTDRVLNYKAFNTFTILCILCSVLIIFEMAFGALRTQLLLHLTARADVKLATYMFEKVLNLPMDFFERRPVGLVARDMNEIWKIRNFLSGQLLGSVLDSVVLLFFLPVMFVYSPGLTAIVVGMCGLIVLWVVIMLPPYQRRSGAVISAEGDRSSFLVQTLQGIRTVKTLALDARQRALWDVLVARVAKARLAEGSMANLIHTVVKPLERFMVSGTFAIGVYMAMTSDDPVYVGALFAFVLLTQRVAHPLVQMAQLIHQYDEARTSVKMVSYLVNQPAEEGRSAQAVRTPLRGHLEFSKVVFKYKGALSPALNNVSFEIPEGGTLGVMGRSGSGKTTITRLLQRLHSDYQGLIRIDGIDVRQYDVDYLRRSLGVVLQENFLFSGTIRQNIAIAKPDATMADIVRAARLAGAEEFIERLPMGYETHIYEGSPNLSGGQRQRLAIARALITDPRILILDEATSALDAESEAIVNANLRYIAKGRTVIVISHRLSALVSADAILVLDKGEVNDIGRHEELLERCDIYSSLWHQQNGHLHPVPQARTVLRARNHG